MVKTVGKKRDTGRLDVKDIMANVLDIMAKALNFDLEVNEFELKLH